jgi:hypothetical protein
MFELAVAAKLLLTAPESIVGHDRAAIERRFGAPSGVGTDTVRARRGDGTSDHVVTLDWPDIRVRLYTAEAEHTTSLIGVTVTKDLMKIDSPVHIGVDRGSVLRELGPPAYEDRDQIVYSLQQKSVSSTGDTLRLVFENDRVIGIDWTYPLEQRPLAARSSSSK